MEIYINTKDLTKEELETLLAWQSRRMRALNQKPKQAIKRSVINHVYKQRHDYKLYAEKAKKILKKFSKMGGWTTDEIIEKATGKKYGGGVRSRFIAALAKKRGIYMRYRKWYAK